MSLSHAQESLMRFRDEFIDKSDRHVGLSLGFPTDDEPLRICVLVFSDNVPARDKKADSLRKKLPEEFEGLTVCVKGEPMSVLY